MEYDWVAALIRLLTANQVTVEEVCDYIEVKKEAVQEWIEGKRSPLGGVIALRIEGFVRRHNQSGETTPLENPPCSSISQAIRQGVMQKTFTLADATSHSGYSKPEELLRAVRTGKFTGGGEKAAKLEWFLAKHGLWEPPRLYQMEEAGKRIFELVGSSAITVDALAEQLGSSRNRVLCWLAGNNRPLKDIAAKVMAIPFSGSESAMPMKLEKPSAESLPTRQGLQPESVLASTLAEVMMMLIGLGGQLLERGTAEDRAAFRRKYRGLPENAKVVSAGLCSERARRQWMDEREG